MRRILMCLIAAFTLAACSSGPKGLEQQNRPLTEIELWGQAEQQKTPEQRQAEQRKREQEMQAEWWKREQERQAEQRRQEPARQAERQKQEQERRARLEQEEREKELVRGYIELSSEVSGPVLVNGEATTFMAEAGKSVTVTIENAKDAYILAVKDSEGTVCQAAAVTIGKTGKENIYKAVVLSQRTFIKQQMARGYVELTSGISGTVLVNGEETEFITEAYKTITLTIENAKGDYTLAVKDSAGNVFEALTPINIEKTTEVLSIYDRESNYILVKDINGKDYTWGRGDSYGFYEYIRYTAVVLDPNPPLNAPEDFDVLQNADGSITIKGYKGTRIQVVIPDTLYGQKVTHIGEMAFERTGLFSVVIPDSVISIEGAAFAANNLVRVNLGNGLKEIGDSAFQRNTFLNEIVIPDSVITIDIEAFANCDLTSIKWGKGLKTIAQSAFNENKLETLTIPNGVELVDKWAFTNNPLTTVVIPPSLTKYQSSGSKRLAGIGDVFDFTLTRITLPANMVDENLNSFDKNLVNFYKSQKKAAGAYVKNGPVWVRE